MLYLIRQGSTLAPSILTQIQNTAETKEVSLLGSSEHALYAGGGM